MTLPPGSTKAHVTGSEIVADAKRYLGIPYKWGGGPGNPRAGLDCSGLIERVAFDLGINSCPRTSEEQWTWSQHTNRPGPGDLVFFVGSDGEPGSPGHVGIVIEPGTMINAPYTGTVVRIDHYSMSGSGANAVVGFGSMQGSTILPGKSGASVQRKDTQLDSIAGGTATAGGIMAGIVGFLMIILAALILIFIVMRQL